jgi:hypothetical protein
MVMRTLLPICQNNRINHLAAGNTPERIKVKMTGIIM